jgi:arylsulfatase A-like enzyme
MGQKNILILLVDCLRADVAIREEKKIETPFIDALKENGTTYINAFSVASSTSPAIASIMTGLYPPVHGIAGLMGYKLNPSCNTLSSILQSHGYTTYAFVSGPLIPETSLDKGFTEYNHRKGGNYVYTQFGEHLIERLKSLKSPWLCFIHFWEIHVPRQIPYRYTPSDNLSLYEQAAESLDKWLYKNLLKIIDLQNTVVVFTGDHGEKDSPFIEKLMASKNFQRIDNRLHIKRKFMNFRKRYLINRKNLPLWFGHGYHLYDFLIRIPLIIIADGNLDRSSVNTTMASQIDLLPTILELVGIKPPSNINGMSMVDSSFNNDRALYIEASNLSADRKGYLWIKGIRTSSWKYITPVFNRKLKEELYNMEEDPYEKRNLAFKEIEHKTKMLETLHNIEKEMNELKKLYSERLTMTEEEMTKMEKLLKELGYL